MSEDRLNLGKKEERLPIPPLPDGSETPLPVPPLPDGTLTPLPVPSLPGYDTDEIKRLEGIVNTIQKDLDDAYSTYEQVEKMFPGTAEEQLDKIYKENPDLKKALIDAGVDLYSLNTPTPTYDFWTQFVQPKIDKLHEAEQALQTERDKNTDPPSGYEISTADFQMSEPDDLNRGNVEAHEDELELQKQERALEEEDRIKEHKLRLEQFDNELHHNEKIQKALDDWDIKQRDQGTDDLLDGLNDSTEIFVSNIESAGGGYQGEPDDPNAPNIDDPNVPNIPGPDKFFPWEGHPGMDVPIDPFDFKPIPKRGNEGGPDRWLGKEGPMTFDDMLKYKKEQWRKLDSEIEDINYTVPDQGVLNDARMSADIRNQSRIKAINNDGPDRSPQTTNTWDKQIPGVEAKAIANAQPIEDYDEYMRQGADFIPGVGDFVENTTEKEASELFSEIMYDENDPTLNPGTDPLEFERQVQEPVTYDKQISTFNKETRAIKSATGITNQEKKSTQLKVEEAEKRQKAFEEKYGDLKPVTQQQFFEAMDSPFAKLPFIGFDPEDYVVIPKQYIDKLGYSAKGHFIKDVLEGKWTLTPAEGKAWGVTPVGTTSTQQQGQPQQGQQQGQPQGPHEPQTPSPPPPVTPSTVYKKDFSNWSIYEQIQNAGGVKGNTKIGRTWSIFDDSGFQSAIGVYNNTDYIRGGKMINQWVSEQQGYKGELAQDWYNKIFVPTYQQLQSRKDKEQHFIQSQTNIFHYQNHFMPQYTIENTSPFSNTGGIKYGTQYQVQEFNTGRMNLGKPTINWGGFDWSKNQMKGFGG